MLSEPFYGHYLASLQKQVMATGDTNSPNLAPVLEIKLHGSCDVELVCDLAHWQTLNPQQQVGALKHEALHLVLGHVFQRGGYAEKHVLISRRILSLINTYSPSKLFLMR